LSALVTGLAASWLGSYSDGSAAVSADRSCGDLVERNCHVVSNRPIALNRQVVTNPRRRSEPATSASSPVDVVLGSGVQSQTPDGHRRCPVCHSASSSYGSRSSCNVYGCLPLTIRAVSELAVVSSADFAAVYEQLHVADTSMLL